MRLTNPLLPNEVGRTALLAFLLFTNTLVLEASDVIATSGFVSNVGVDQILVVWAAVMLITMLTASAYSIFVDRVQRGRFAVLLFFGTSLIHLGVYFLFTAQLPSFFTYGLLSIIIEQQWALLPMIVWALASDMFTVAAAKRVFPLLSTVVIIGKVVGNGIAAALGEWLAQASYTLLIFNSGLLLLAAVLLFLVLPRLGTLNQQRLIPDERLRDQLKEGLDFVQHVPAYRFLALIMILMGFCLNTIQYQFLVDVATTYTDPGQLQAFYGIFKLASVPVMLLVQSTVTPWLLQHTSFKTIFAWMPGSTFLALLLTCFWLSPTGGLLVTGAIVGNYLMRVVVSSIDQPARQAFQGLVPDQRRGRVSALMGGFLYQGGSVLSCLVVGGLLLGVQAGWFLGEMGRVLYTGVALICALAALVLVYYLYRSYDASMLNWRLKRRQHGKSVLDQLKF